MAARKIDSLYHLLNFHQDILTNQNLHRDDVKFKQIDDDIRKQEERHSNMTPQEKQDTDRIWASISSIVTSCNSAGEYFLKIGFDDLAFPYLEKARRFLDSITRPELKEKRERKILKVAVMRNLSFYYNNRQNYKQASQCLKKVLELQTNFEGKDIISGFEFVYINLAFFSKKEEKWEDAHTYASQAVNYLERMLEIKAGAPILDNKPASKEKHISAVYYKKLITLSYAYYLLSRSLIKRNNNYVDAINYLEKAYRIGSKYLGENDKLTLKYKKRLEFARRNIMSFDQITPIHNPNAHVPFVSNNFTKGRGKNLEIEVRRSSYTGNGLTLLSDTMPISPAVKDGTKSMSNRETPQGSNFFTSAKFAGNKIGRNGSLASQMSAQMPQSTKNVSFNTQFPIESGTEREDLGLQNQHKNRFNTFLSSRPSSAINSAVPSTYLKVLSANTSLVKDREVRSKHPRTPNQYSLSIYNQDNEKVRKNSSPEDLNRNQLMNIDAAYDSVPERPESTTNKTNLPPVPRGNSGKIALHKMTQRPPSATKVPAGSAKKTVELRDSPYNRPSIKPQKPAHASHSQASRAPIGNRSHRPTSAIHKPKRSPPRGQMDYMEKLNIPAIPKSKSRSPKTKSPSFTFDDDFNGKEFDHERISGFYEDWESVYDTLRSAGRDERSPRDPSPGKKGGKISSDLKNILRSDAKENTSKYGPETLFTKQEEKGAIHTNEQVRSEERLGLERMQSTSENKIDVEDKNSPKMEPAGVVSKIIAKEIINIQTEDIEVVTTLEDEAARRIQRFLRRLKRLGKYPTKNHNPDEQNNVVSANETNSVQHGKPTESPLETKSENHSHNHVETQSSAKLSRLFRRDLLLKFFTDSDWGKIDIEGLHTSIDDIAHEYLQRYRNRKEDEEEFSVNRSFTVESNFMLTKSQHQMNPKIEVIKKNLKSLKAYEISFYGFFFGEAGLWTVRYGGMHEKKGSLFLVFYLCHGTINHPIKVRADLKVTEKAMFYSTIWRVISANMNVFLTKDELFRQLKERIQNDEERLFLIIKDLKNEERLSPILRITPSELDSLREMLIKLCFIMENKFIMYKKGTGYIYEWSKNVENYEAAAMPNKRYLVLCKSKLQNKIRTLAVQYNPFYYTPVEKVQYSVRVNTFADNLVPRTFSGGSFRKSMGTLPGGSDSEGDIQITIPRSQTSQNQKSVNDIREFRKRQPRKDGKKTVLNPKSGGAPNEREKGGLRLPTMQNENQISKLLDQYKNSFVQGQLLFQNVAYLERHFLLTNLRVFFSKNAAKEVSDESQLEFVIEVELFGANRWRDQIKLSYRDFMGKVKTIKDSIEEFMMNAGFLAKQRRVLSTFFTENITIVESKLQLVSPKPIENKSAVVINPSNETSRSTRSFFQRLEYLQKISEPPFYLVDPEHRRQQAQVKVIGTHEPNFGASEVIHPYFQLADNMKQMKYYNSLRYIQPRRYYIAYDQKQIPITLRIDYLERSSHTSMLITLYHHCKGIVDFINIRDRKIQERLLNIMQMDSTEMKKKSLTDIFEFQKSLIGNKLLLNEKVKLAGYNRKFDITPVNISQILMTQGDENLPKYRLDIQKHFTKGVISNLGNCYITITTYFIKNLYKFDNIFCIKLEIMPFTSKTKFYKFLINSKDIKFYLNKDYPKGNPYENWDTIHFIIQSLVLKRQYVYSTIELPIRDTKFMLMKYHKYNLKNVVSQSIESSSIGAKVIFGNFLQPRIQENQVILQITKRINKHYVIITVEKHTILDYWSFIVYDPKTCRKYVTSIYFSDILALNPNFMEKLYSSSATKLENNRKARADYSEFTRSYIDLAAGSITSLKQRSMKHKEDLGSLILDEKPKATKAQKMQNSARDKDKDRNKDQKPKEQNHVNFYEIKFWENVVKNLEISYTKSSNILLILDTFRGVMREFVHRETLQTSATEESLIEVFLENNYKKYTMFEVVNHISLPYIQNHDLFVRVTRLEKMTIYNNRFNLKQVIGLYAKESFSNKVEIPNNNNKVVFSQIKILSQYMTYKIKNWNMVTISEDEIERQTFNRETVLPWTNFKLKLNCNFETITKIDHQRLFINRQLIYRGILTVAPLQMVSLVYSKKKGLIHAYLYDTTESWILKKKLRMTDIITNIPYVGVMLEQQLHYEVGLRIYEALKNSLIVYSFIKKRKIV